MKNLLERIPIPTLWAPGRARLPGRRLSLPGRNGQAPVDPRDPRVLGYDGRYYDALAVVTQETQLLDYATATNDSVELSKDRVITGLTLVADPYQHDVATATITVVEDAVDKVISGLTIAGKETYFSLSSTLAFLKALSNLNKLVHGNIGHEDLATAVANDNLSYQAWHIPFGVLDDLDPFDASAGIPAEDMAALQVSATFGADNLIATTAANGTVDPATDIYVVNWGVQGLPLKYRRSLPIPDFKHDHISTVLASNRLKFQTQRYLKRTTILNLAVAASNNQPRNDSNITNVSIEFRKPTTTKLVDRMRWRVFKHAMQAYYRGVDADRDGSMAVAPGGLTGVAVIDWRRWTHNPFGLNLYGSSEDDVALIIEMGTTTGSLHLFNEYYSLPDPSVAERWECRAGWGRRGQERSGQPAVTR